MKLLPSLVVISMLAAPLACQSQTILFQDTFQSGNLSTLNPTATSPGTLTGSRTAYEIGASKNISSGTTIASGVMTIGGFSTTSAYGEAQALFTNTPITLNTPGQYLEIYYVFTDTTTLFNGTAGANEQINIGLYNSSGIGPTNGAGLWTGNLGTGSSTADVGCTKGWVGYNGMIAYNISGGTYTSEIYTRAAQTAANNSNQGLGASSSATLGGFITGPGVGSEPTLTVGSQYTMDLKIYYVSSTSLLITNTLYVGNGIGGSVFSAGGFTAQYGGTVSGGNFLTNAFDSLCIGFRPTASPASAESMKINNVTVISYVPTAPTITGLTNETVIAGTSPTLSPTVTGLPTPAYQWQLTNGVSGFTNIPGATTATLTLNNVQYAQNGYVYSLIASNSVAAVTNSMTLSVIVTPSIAGLSGSQNAAVGSTVTFSPTVSGVPTPGLQWQRGATPASATNLIDGATGNGSTFAGSTTSTLNIINVQTADSTTYFLIATNAAGLVTNSVVLAVGSFAPSITGLTNQSVLAGNNATLSATVGGAPAPALQWYLSTDGGVSSNTIAGATGSWLTLTNVQYSQNAFEYYLLASNSSGVLVSNMTLTVTQIAPTISGLTNQTIIAGFNATLSATVGGAPAPALQWLLKGAPIASATNTALTLASVRASQNGNVYSLVASNAAGVATNSMTLTVTNLQLCINLDVKNSSGANPYTGTAAAPDSGTLWNHFATPASGATLTLLNVNNSLGSPTTASATIATSGTGFSFWDDSSASTGNPNPVSLMRGYLFPGGTETVTVSNLTQGTYTLYAYAHGNAENQNSTVTLNATNGGAGGATSSTTASGYRDITTGPGIAYVALTGTNSSSGTISFTTSYLNGFQLQYDSVAGVSGLTNETVVAGTTAVLSPTITGTGPLAYQWNSNSVALAGATNASLTLNNVQYGQNGTVYSLVASNAAGSDTNSMTLTVIVTPAITGLNNQDVATNSTVTINATVSGVPTPTLQWLTNGVPTADGPDANGSTISGSQTSTLTLVNAQVGDTGTYSLVASNSAGIVTNSMYLTVAAGNLAPTITGPTSITVIQGNNGTFSAFVSGLPVPALQWLDQTGTPIPGATNPALTLTNVQYSQNGYAYSLVASNVAGSVTNSATLTVTVPPVITSQPASLVVTNTQSASFTVAATGEPAPTYQWYMNGSLVSSTVNSTATNATFTIASAVVTNNGGSFYVQISNSAGTTNSATVTLTVNSAMAVAALSPANGATNVCYDTPLYLTFGQVPTLQKAGTIKIYNVTNSATPVDTINLALSVNNPGAGGNNIAFNIQPRTIAGETFTNFPVIITGNTAAIYPHLDLLSSNQTYYVTLDNGTFTDAAGANFAGITVTNAWQFTTKAGGPANPTNLVVAADGSGDFVTVQGALDSVPSANTTPTVINIHNGIYTEIVDIHSKNNLLLRGQSRSATLVGYPNNANLQGSTHYRMAFKVNGNDIALDNLTVTNMTPVGGAQAEALMLETGAARFILNNANVGSYQDTLLANTDTSVGYFNNSLIEGQFDYIWGGGNLFFTNCELRTLLGVNGTTSGGNVTASRTGNGATGNWAGYYGLYASNGISFVGCNFTRVTNTIGSTTLADSNGTTNGNVAWINCSFDTNYITPAAGVLYSQLLWEYGNSNLTDTASVSFSLGVGDSAPELTASDSRLLAAQSATIWLNGWVPQLSPNILTNPVGQTVNYGSNVTFTVAATGIPAPTYQWLSNGIPITGLTGLSYAIASANTSDAASYSVVVSNSAGVVTSSAATLVVNPQPNTSPVFTAPPANTNITINVGVNLAVACTATDATPQTLTYALLVAPAGATLDTNAGVLSWRPTVAQAGSTNNFSVAANTSILPVLSATNNFTITVNPLTAPTPSSPIYAGGIFSITVTGQAGPDYELQATTNLAGGTWVDVAVTNSPASPFLLTDPNAGAQPAQFYRIVTGPPLP